MLNKKTIYYYDYTYSYYDMLKLRFGMLVSKPDKMLTELVNEALDNGNWHRTGGSVYFSFPEECGGIDIIANKALDKFTEVFTGVCLSEGFIGRRVDRKTSIRIATKCAHIINETY